MIGISSSSTSTWDKQPIATTTLSITQVTAIRVMSFSWGIVRLFCWESAQVISTLWHQDQPLSMPRSIICSITLLGSSPPQKKPSKPMRSTILLINARGFIIVTLSLPWTLENNHPVTSISLLSSKSSKRRWLMIGSFKPNYQGQQVTQPPWSSSCQYNSLTSPPVTWNCSVDNVLNVQIQVSSLKIV